MVMENLKEDQEGLKNESKQSLQLQKVQSEEVNKLLMQWIEKSNLKSKNLKQLFRLNLLSNLKL